MAFKSFKNALEIVILLVDALLADEKDLIRLLHWLLVKGRAVPVESSRSRLS